MFYKDKKVVVTGGSGFVGSHYLSELLKRGADVRTHTHIRPLQVSDDRIEILENIDLENIDGNTIPAEYSVSGAGLDNLNTDFSSIKCFY